VDWPQIWIVADLADLQISPNFGIGLANLRQICAQKWPPTARAKLRLASAEENPLGICMQRAACSLGASFALRVLLVLSSS